MGISLRWLLLLQRTVLGTWASVVAAGGLLSMGSVVWCTGLVVPGYVGSSRIRDQPMSPAFADRILFTVPPGKSCLLNFYEGSHLQGYYI